jgi:glycosyltransferase
LERIMTKSREDYRAIRTNGVGGAGTLVLKNLSKLRQFA